MKSRARRRQDLERIKRRARRLSRLYTDKHDDSAFVAGCREAWVRQANHLASCSCWMCGNPRRWNGERTLRERRADLDRDRPIT
jgi:hypothetical protein